MERTYTEAAVAALPSTPDGLRQKQKQFEVRRRCDAQATRRTAEIHLLNSDPVSPPRTCRFIRLNQHAIQSPPTISWR